MAESSSMGEEEREYDIERDLEEMRDVLRTEDIECPNCSSKFSPHLERCPTCGYRMKKVSDMDFENKLKTTMWSPKIGRGIPLGREPSPRMPSKATAEKLEPVAEEPKVKEAHSPTQKEKELTVEEQFVMEAFTAKERMKMTTSVALVLFGVAFYIASALSHSMGYVVLLVMVLGTVLVLVGGNMAFDTLIDRRDRKAASRKASIKDSLPTLKERLLRPGDNIGKVVWSVMVVVGTISYVLAPLLMSDGMLQFLSMGMGSILIVFGISSAYNSFFRERARKEEAHVYEAIVETKEEEKKEALDWACPVCSTPLGIDVLVCPKCGTEFEE